MGLLDRVQRLLLRRKRPAEYRSVWRLLLPRRREFRPAKPSWHQAPALAVDIDLSQIREALQAAGDRQRCRSELTNAVAPMSDRTRALMAATAGWMVLHLWDALARAAIDDGDRIAPGFAPIQQHADLPRQALCEVERWAAGIDRVAERDRMGATLDEVNELIHGPVSPGEYFECQGGSDVSGVTERALMATLPTWRGRPGLVADAALEMAESCTCAAAGEWLDDPVARARHLANWWAACTRRLAFKDVFTAEIELGEPPPPWPGDDPPHLQRVAQWEAMSDADRQAAIDVRAAARAADTITLRSGRVISRG
ncbi:MAG: hypothetical protein AB7K09_13350 [Planctomycetota bacterium]